MAIDWREVIDHLDESVTVYDRQGRLVFLNASAARPFGKPMAELIGHAPWELVPPGPRTAFRDALEGVLAGGPKVTVVAHVQAFARSYEADIYPHPDGAIALARDVTERVRAAAALSESEERFRAMVEYAPEAIVIVNAETLRFEAANDAARALFGRSLEDIVRMGPLGLSPERQPDGTSSAEGVRRYAEEVIAVGTAEVEWTMLRADGTEFTTEVRARLLPSVAPRLVRASIFDVTARRRAQERAEATQRLEALGRLAGGVAHDFNNLLMVISSYAQLALRSPEARGALGDDLTTILSAADRAMLLTRQLLMFGRRSRPSPRVLDLNAHVEEMRALLTKLVGEHVEIELDLAQPAGRVRLDPADVEQILLNLASNARDAMPNGGRVTIQTSSTLIGKEDAAAQDMPPGPYVTLRVTDTGAGIPAHVIPHVFEPFFTTKDVHHGTGLGLATVYGIVRQNEGHIRVESPPGRGASFVVLFPAREGGEAPALAPVPPPAPPRRDGGEIVLVVDDDELVRKAIHRTLQGAGYRVIEARNAGEALLIFESRADPIPLLVTDVVMPRVTGMQLAARLRKLEPRLRVLFLSGHPADQLALERDGEHDAFVAKPVSPDDLLRTVRNVLDAREE